MSARDEPSAEVPRDPIAEAGTGAAAALARAGRFEALFELSNALACVAGLSDGRFRHLNAAWTRTLGWSHEELTARPYLDFVHPDDRAATLREAAALGRPGAATVAFENRYRCADGGWRWLSWHATSDPGADLVYAIAVDISGRMAAEAALRQATDALAARGERLRAQGQLVLELSASEALHRGDVAGAVREVTEAAARGLEVARAAVWLLDDAGDVLRCVDLYEPAAGRHTAGLVLRRADFPAYFAALAEARFIDAHDAARDPRTACFRDVYFAPHGITSLLDAPIISDGRVRGVVCHEHVGPPRRWAPEETALAATLASLVSLALEAADRRRAEAAAAQARDEALAAAQVKSQFLANMSHELRTPLNGLLGMLSLALDGPLDPEAREHLQTAAASGRALRALIDDVLDVSKLEAHRLELERAPLSVRDLAAEAADAVAVTAHQQGLELVVDVAPDVPDRSLGDATRLRQVLVNLLGNAVKFTPRGRVVLSIRRATGGPEGAPGAGAGPGPEASAEGIDVAVEDTGVGIPEDRRGRIFEAFMQADGSTTRRYGGTGLGLTISRALVRAMGGELTVVSRPGEGSTFRFRALLPAVAPAASAATAAAPLAGRAALVVDDDPAARAALARLLRGWGLAVDEADGAEAARARLAQAPPPWVALIDATLPPPGGAALCAALADDPRGRGALRVLLATRERRLAPGERAAADRVVAKPPSAAALLEALTGGSGAAEAPRTPAEPRGASAAPATPATPATRPLRVLLAEDNAINARLAARILERAGHRVVHVASGRAAVDAVAREPFDIVLMDVQMPELDGLEATRAIRAREPAGARRVPIVALTASAQAGDAARCLAAGMDAHLAKPLDPGALRGEVERLAGAAGMPPGGAPPDRPDASRAGASAPGAPTPR